MAKKKILVLSTIDLTIWRFLQPQVELLREMGFSVHVGCRDTGYLRTIEADAHHALAFARNPLAWGNLKAFFRLIDLLRREKYAAIHVHTPVAAFWGRLAARAAGVPVVIYTAHGFHFQRDDGPSFYRLAESLLARLTDHLITINSEDYEAAKTFRLAPGGKVHQVPGVGVDTDFFRRDRFGESELNTLRHSLGLAMGDKVVTMVAEFNPGKGHRDLLRGIPVIIQAIPEAKFLFVGDGPLRMALEKEAPSGSVSFLGWRNDVSEILAISDCLVLPSYREGLPRAVLEAMSMELPVVAYDVRGCRDLVVKAQTGFLEVPGDEVGLAAAIVRILRDSGFAKQMGWVARQRIREGFSQDEVLERMQEIFDDIFQWEMS